MVNQVHYNLYYGVHLICSALCYHQSESYKRSIGDALRPVWAIEYAVVLHKPEE